MTPSDPVRPHARARLGCAVVLAVLVGWLLAGCGGGGTADPAAGPSVPTPAPPAPPAIQGPIIPASVDLHAGPVPTPLELRLPTLAASAPVLGVGLTVRGAMDAPEGPAGTPIWQEAFWYRGGGIPGDDGTATIAGHVDDTLGRPALFAHLRDLHSGDPVVIHDTRSGLDIRFTVREVATYSVQQASQPAVLAAIFGAGPVAGTGPQPAPDGLAHLTLVTCAGDFVHGSYDHRIVVDAQRVG
jgi:Sortase domain